MKKIITAAFAAAFATAVQAASVSWGGAVATPDGSSALAAGQQALLLYSTTAFTGAATTLSGAAVGATANNGGSVVSAYTLTSTDVGGAYAFGAEWVNEGADVNGYYAILVVNESGTMASYMDMGQITGTTELSSATSLLFNPDWSNSDHLVMNGYTVNVPEPTGATLLLLGVAGLALRRKRG